MGLIREPLNIDFFVEQAMLTDEERTLISEFISADKQKRKIESPFKKNASLAPAKGKPKAISIIQ